MLYPLTSDLNYQKNTPVFQPSYFLALATAAASTVFSIYPVLSASFFVTGFPSTNFSKGTPRF